MCMPISAEATDQGVFTSFHEFSHELMLKLLLDFIRKNGLFTFSQEFLKSPRKTPEKSQGGYFLCENVKTIIYIYFIIFFIYILNTYRSISFHKCTCENSVIICENPLQGSFLETNLSHTTSAL